MIIELLGTMQKIKLLIENMENMVDQLKFNLQGPEQPKSIRLSRETDTIRVERQDAQINL